MTNHGDEVRDFLTSRRARVNPESVGLPGGNNRRVPGLRRNEVSALAGMSVEYYSRMERGDLRGVSESVLEAVGRALCLDEAEQAHLFALGRTANLSPVKARRPTPRAVRPSVLWALESMTLAPAFVRNARLDVVAENSLFRALYRTAYAATDKRPLNMARFTFLQSEVSQVLYGDWEASANINAEILRTEAGLHPNDKQLQDLVGELSTLSADFRTRWGAHNVRLHNSGTKPLHHPDVGDLDLVYDTLSLGGAPELSMVIYSAEPGSATEQSLRLLASWDATQRRAAADEAAPEKRSTGIQPT